MKRDWDLIRSILILTEDQSPGQLIHDFSSLAGDPATVVEHIRLANNSGLIEAKLLDFHGGSEAIIIRLTPAGHDFLEQARQPVLWNKAKDVAAKAGVGVTVDILKAALGHLALAALTKAMTG